LGPDCDPTNDLQESRGFTHEEWQGGENMRADCHMHTYFSGDSEAKPEDMILAAIDKGLEAICFTDHEDIDYFCDDIEFVFDPETYFKELGALKEKYKEKLDIRIGVEFGLQPHLAKKAKAFTTANPYVFVIGSMHVVGGKDPYYPEFFEGISDEEAYRMALRETIADIRAVADFDVLGHLDYVVRYGKHREQEYSYSRFADEIDEILRYLIEHGKGLEVNTAGLKYGLPFAHPHPDVLKRYKELGGEIITVGADAHKPEHVGYDFNIVDNILEACGFKYYAEFIKRIPVFRKIK